MKTNILYTSSYPSLKGGGQRSLLLILKYLNKDKHRPFLLVAKHGELSEAAQKLGVEVCILDLPRLRSFNIFKVLKSFVCLSNIVKENKIDIIHTESPRETIYAGILKVLSKFKLVTHLRVSDPNKFLDFILYQFSNALIAVSNSVAKRFDFLKCSKKLNVVYNSVELDKYPYYELVLSSSCLNVAYFGRIDRRKGIETLIQAVKKQSFPLRLLVMGEGDDEYLEELKALASDNVYFKEYSSDPRDEMMKSDLIVLPSLYGEGLSRLILEGMALGKIVIVSDIPENVEALGPDFNYNVFKAGDSDSLSLCIKNIVEAQRDIQLISRGSRERAEKEFDVILNTKKIEQVYESIG